MAVFYNEVGISPAVTKVFNGVATVGDNGEWEINYSHVGFNDVFSVQATPFSTLDSTDKTPTGASVYFNSLVTAKGTCLKGVSVGFLVGATNLWANPGTKIYVTVTGH